MSGSRPYTQTPCRAVCTDCGHEWRDHYIKDAGAAYLATHKQCPLCGSNNIDATERMPDDE